ncbi:MAG: nuclear transport factor 2 family protein, partial [Planctomycetota bacterium]
DPSNSIRHRDDLIALFSSGQVSYSSFKTSIDYADQLGEDLVVIMGTESSTQSSVPSDAGLEEATVASTLNRRFTNVYRREDGIWRLLIKQSTIFSVE